MSSKFHSPQVTFSRKAALSPEAALSTWPAPPDLGALPEWRLQDLYESIKSPRFAADLERAEQEAKSFAKAIAARLRRLRLKLMRAKSWR